MNSPTSLQDDFSSINTNSSNVLHALQVFLERNQIEVFEHFQIQLESTNEDGLKLSISGRINPHNNYSFNQVESTSAWPSTLTPPHEAVPSYKTAELTNITPMCDQSANLFPLEGRATDIESIYSEVAQTQVLPSQPVGSPNVLNRACLFPSDWSDLLAIPTPSLSSSPHPTWNISGLSPSFDSFSSIGTGVQDPQISSNLSNAAHLDTPCLTNWNRCPSPMLESTIESDDSLVPGSSTANIVVQAKAKSHPPQDASELKINRLSQNVLREDFYNLLQSELPRWTSEGLNGETHVKSPELDMPRDAPSPSRSSYSKLERAYTTVCRLNSRMDDDLLRNRIALIQLHLEYVGIHQGQRHKSPRTCKESMVGRGNASHVIDNILANIHRGWKALDPQRRSELRAKFHERKKYGKRWYQLANGLGPGILLVCSTKLANAVRSTTTTAKTLDAVVKRVKLLDDDTVRTIDIVSPLVESLMKNDGFDKLDHQKILSQLLSCSDFDR